VKDVLKCIMVEDGEQCAIMDSVTQQQELFAICSGTDAPDGFLVGLTATETAADRYGWTTFSAMERKRTFQTVNTTAGAVTTALTVKKS